MSTTTTTTKPKVALITGCSSGIGYALAEDMASRGFKVYATARIPESLKDLVAKHKENIVAVALDVSNQISIEKAVAQVIKNEGKIDILVNNAGQSCTMPAAEVEVDRMRQAFEANFFGLVAVTNQVFPHMAAQRSGKIVNIGSIVGKLTMPFGGIYSATKAAVELYTDGLRVEIKPFGIQTMLVRPGAVRSAIASHGYYIKEEGIFSPFKACIHKRSQISQASPSTTPANVFAKGVVDAIVRKNMPLSYTAGDKSWLVVFFLARLPKFIQDWLASKIFGLSQVVLPAAPSSNKQIKSE